MTTTHNIPIGYKQTEIGVIPEDWECPELMEITKDGSPICYGIVQVGVYTRNGIPVLAIKNLNSNYKTRIHRTSADIEKSYARSRIRQDDVLISVKGTTGRVGIVPLKFNGNISRDIARIRPKKGIFPKFLHQMLQSELAQRRLLNAAVGTTRMELSIAILKKMRFLLPPAIVEQTAIATVLSDTDALIEQLEKLITKKKALKQGTMQQLLTGKKRLHGFSGEWKVKKLGNISEIKTGKKNNDDKVEEGLYPFFVRSQQIERIDSYSFDGEAILIPGEGNIGSIYHYINGKFDYHQRVYKISNFAEQYSGKFIYLSMSQNFNAHATKNSVKATVDSLRLPTFQEFEISFPPTKLEQTAIATIISDMDAEIESLEKKRDKYIMLKQGMMQNLLTGKIRLI